jgi:hypothetical protein
LYDHLQADDEAHKACLAKRKAQEELRQLAKELQESKAGQAPCSNKHYALSFQPDRHLKLQKLTQRHLYDHLQADEEAQKACLAKRKMQEEPRQLAKELQKSKAVQEPTIAHLVYTL